jgi:hypothetical protein|uniref:Uncharacterized protein n=1 Tax=viral metagenome TaxID=1070528 RepID=A0A6C0C453_9ZZZZ
MEPNINTNNKPIYKLDNMHRNLFKSLRENRKQQRQIDFKNWLYTDLGDIIIEDALNKLSDDIIATLKHNGFIVNQKPFRDEMASLIYYNSAKQ